MTEENETVSYNYKRLEMTDIQFKFNSLSIQFKLIEIEDRLPSFQLQMSVQINQFIREFGYSGKLWFQCHSWDSFITALGTSGEIATLNSMSDEDFVFTVSSEEANVKIKTQSTDGTTTMLHHAHPLTDDTFTIIKNAFLEFDRWW
ncbi:MAG: hypothetical protein ACHQHN_10630 [Sphingobacteriales bacterium]